MKQPCHFIIFIIPIARDLQERVDRHFSPRRPWRYKLLSDGSPDFTPLEKATDSCWCYRSFLIDDGSMPPSIVDRELCSLSGFTPIFLFAFPFLNKQILSPKVAFARI